MPKVSIIIAMYNIEDYIAYCINSCVNQIDVTPDDYEIIIVNDGATDNSLNVAFDAINGVSNARVISRPNGGLSAARNTGVENAVGEYLWFVDGDDAIASNALSVLISNIEKYDSDAYLINFSTYDGEKHLSVSNFTGSEYLRSGVDYHFKDLRILPMMAWLTIYKASLVRNYHLAFLSGIQHEDLEFSIRAHHLSTSIAFISDPLYVYRVGRNGSIMMNVRKDNTKSLVSQIEILKSFKSFFEGTDNLFVRRLYGMCSTSFWIRRYDCAFVLNPITENLISEYRFQLYKDMWKSKQWKRRALLLFILIMPEFVLKQILPRIGNRSKLM